MECIERLIGLKGLCEPEYENRVYVNDLPMGTLKRFSQTANYEDKTGYNLFLKLRKKAAEEVVKDFFDKSNIESIIYLSQEDVGHVFTDDVVTGENTLQLNNKLRNNHSKVYLEHISIKTEKAQEIELNISIDGCEDSTEKIDLDCGINVIPINRMAKKIKIHFNAEQVYSVKEFNSCHDPCGGNCFDYSIDEPTMLQFTASCVIDLRSLICENAELFADATNWMLLSMLMDEAKYRDDMSILLRNSRDEAIGYYASIMGGTDPETGGKISRPKYWVELSRVVRIMRKKYTKYTKNKSIYTYKE